MFGSRNRQHKQSKHFRTKLVMHTPAMWRRVKEKWRKSWQNVCQMACKFQWVLVSISQHFRVLQMPGFFFLVPFSALLYVTGAFRYSLIGYARRCVCLCCVHAPVRTLDHFSFIRFAQLIHKQVHVAIIVPLLKPITATNVRKLCVSYQTLHL